MSRQQRILFQVVIWFIFTIFIANSQVEKTIFILETICLFIVQCIFIILIIWYLAPKLLFKKKHLQFILLGIILTIGCTLLIIVIFPLPKAPFLVVEYAMPLPPPHKPLRFINHTLMLGFSFILATLVESVYYGIEKEKETIQNKNEQLQTELKLLKSQINPHFLFNALNNIYSLSVINSPKTQESISYLSDMLRYVLYDCEQNLVAIDKEMKYIRNYIKLFGLKSSKPFNITTNFNVENNAIKLAPMLFIPFIENAFKHSSIEKQKDRFITIDLEADASTINFSVRNSIPKTPNEKDAVGGIGLENVKKRLGILYPNKHQLQISGINDVFDVRLQLKLNNDA